MEIEFHGQYDKKSFIKAVLLASKPSRRNTLMRLGVTLICVVIYAAYFINLANRDNVSTFESVRHGLGLLLLGYFLFEPYIYAYIAALQYWKNPSYQKPFNGVISVEGIAFFTSSNGRREIDWEDFASKRTTEDLLVLLYDTGEFTFFTRQFFNNGEDWNRVIRLVNYEVVEAV